MTNDPEKELESVKRLGEKTAALKAEIAKTIVGQDEVIEQLLIAVGYDPQPPMLFHEPSRFCVRTR